MEATSLVGLVAGALTTVAFIPQVLHVVRSRSTRDISLGMFVLFSVGVALWFVYGLMLGDPAIIVANGATLAMALVILGYKLRFG